MLFTKKTTTINVRFGVKFHTGTCKNKGGGGNNIDFGL